MLMGLYRHGYPFMMFERMKFIEMLYDTLADKSKVKRSKDVVAIEQNDNGVLVRLADGTIEKGDIAIGADGVNSHVRTLMFEKDKAKTKKTGWTLFLHLSKIHSLTHPNSLNITLQMSLRHFKSTTTARREARRNGRNAFNRMVFPYT
jgi:2-polyprenyl-6-methoxyphenol hydroxylase-like FAD-dependent oxidoreductase